MLPDSAVPCQDLSTGRDMNHYRERIKKEAAKRRALIMRMIASDKTMEEIGNFLGITKQRVSQLAKDAKSRETP